MFARKFWFIRLDWVIYLLAGIGLISWLSWSIVAEFARNPVRDATADLGAYGLVTIRLTTSPFPPLPTETVNLNFMAMDQRRRPLEIDALAYEYGPIGTDQPAGSGTAETMSGDNDMFMAGVQFPSVGDWWIRARITKGNTQADVRFIVNVKPAQ